MMNADQYVFRRVEIKYLLDNARYLSLLETLHAHGYRIDAYGENTISNIYYDTDDYYLIRHSLDKPIYKEKLRLRAYGTPGEDSPAFVEIKKKFKGVVYKRRVTLPLCQATRALEKGRMPDGLGQIGDEINWFLNTYRVSPRAMIAYDREALFSDQTPDLRITFDHAIRFRDTALNLSCGSAGTLLFPGDMRLMEIKTSYSIPVWLCDALWKDDIRRVSFSKYGECYVRYIQKSGREALYSA